MNWDDLRYFLAVARGTTLARAGARLGIAPTTVGRRLAALEEETGTRLFDRTPDGYALTLSGRDLLPHAERMEAEALAIAREVSGADARLSGVVRLSATEMIATRFIAPELPRLRARHPELVVDLSCTNRTVSLARREADIALRLSRPREPNVVVKQLARIELSLYAARGYVERRGTPADPDRSLAGHDMVLFADAPPFAIENDWLEARRDGAAIVLRSDSVSSIYSATVGGLGIALLPRLVADRDASLVRIPTEAQPEPRIVWQAVHEDLKSNPRIRAVCDFLGEVL